MCGDVVGLHWTHNGRERLVAQAPIKALKAAVGDTTTIAIGGPATVSIYVFRSQPQSSPCSGVIGIDAPPPVEWKATSGSLKVAVLPTEQPAPWGCPYRVEIEFINLAFTSPSGRVVHAPPIEAIRGCGGMGIGG